MQDIFLKNFGSIMEAELAKRLLEADGIKSFIQKRTWTNPGGDAMGADLFVSEKDLREASKILDSDA
jgi:hypothetical protein